MGHLKALMVAALFSLILLVGWQKYSNFLEQGKRPSVSAKKLNELQEVGIPDLELIDISGRNFRLSQFDAELIIVNFWASWCDPCIAEFPSLLKLLDHYKGKIVLVAISADNSLDDLNTFLKAFKANSPYLYVTWDKDKKAASQFGTKVLPESYIVRKDLSLIRKIAGVDDWYNPEALEYFESLMVESSKK